MPFSRLLGNRFRVQMRSRPAPAPTAVVTRSATPIATNVVSMTLAKVVPGSGSGSFRSMKVTPPWFRLKPHAETQDVEHHKSMLTPAG